MASVPNGMSSVSTQSKPLRVAVVGGGIGGVLLAIGLLKHPHVDVHVYESAPSFGEIGAGIALGPNAQRALELIGPEAHEAFLKNATSNLWPSHANIFMEYIVGEGVRENECIVALENSTGMQCLHRAFFLDELVKAVPAQRAHFNKHVESIEDEPEKEVIVRFKDGTMATSDAVIGADGIHSHVRDYLLGKEASQLVYAGCVAYRGVVSMDAAIEKLGAERAQNVLCLCGHGKGILSYPIDHGRLLNIAALNYQHEHWEHKKSIVPAKRETLEQMYKGWGKLARGYLELLDTPDLAAWQMCEAPIAPCYSKNRVVMMGDAAHATTPFQAAGAGQAIEDALVLTTLLSKVTDPNQISNAFIAFDQVRRPRTQRVMTTSREMGRLQGFMQEGVGNDAQKIRQAMSSRMKWIWQRDMGAQNKEAVALFEESL